MGNTQYRTNVAEWLDELGGKSEEDWVGQELSAWGQLLRKDAQEVPLSRVARFCLALARVLDTECIRGYWTSPQVWHVEVAIEAGQQRYKTLEQLGKRGGERKGKDALLTALDSTAHFVGKCQDELLQLFRKMSDLQIDMDSPFEDSVWGDAEFSFKCCEYELDLPVGYHDNVMVTLGSRISGAQVQAADELTLAQKQELAAKRFEEGPAFVAKTFSHDLVGSEDADPRHLVAEEIRQLTPRGESALAYQEAAWRRLNAAIDRGRAEDLIDPGSLKSTDPGYA